jgi:hypothetical protein
MNLGLSVLYTFTYDRTDGVVADTKELLSRLRFDGLLQRT